MDEPDSDVATGERSDDHADHGTAWAATDHYRLLGVGFKIRSVDAGIAAALRWYLSPFRQERETPLSVDIMLMPRDEDRHLSPPPLSYFRGPEAKFTDPDPRAVFKYAAWEIHYAAQQLVRSFLVIHAASVSTPEGALVLPAPPETGKSTIAAALIRRGFSYLSDEVAALDPVTSRVYPHPRHIHLSPESVALFPGLEDRLDDRRDGWARSKIDRTVRIEDLDGTRGSPAPARWLVFMDSDREGVPRLSPLSRAEAVEQMAASAMNLYRYRDRGVILLGRVAAAARAFTLKGGGTLDRAELLAERLLSA